MCATGVGLGRAGWWFRTPCSSRPLPSPQVRTTVRRPLVSAATQCSAGARLAIALFAKFEALTAKSSTRRDFNTLPLRHRPPRRLRPPPLLSPTGADLWAALTDSAAAFYWPTVTHGRSLAHRYRCHAHAPTHTLLRTGVRKSVYTITLGAASGSSRGRLVISQSGGRTC